jgi:hypothetical protein
MVAVALAAAFGALCPTLPDGLAEIAASNPPQPVRLALLIQKEDETDVL